MVHVVSRGRANGWARGAVKERHARDIPVKMTKSRKKPSKFSLKAQKGGEEPIIDVWPSARRLRSSGRGWRQPRPTNLARFARVANLCSVKPLEPRRPTLQPAKRRSLWGGGLFLGLKTREASRRPDCGANGQPPMRQRRARRHATWRRPKRCFRNCSGCQGPRPGAKTRWCVHLGAGRRCPTGSKTESARCTHRRLANWALKKATGYARNPIFEPWPHAEGRCQRGRSGGLRQQGRKQLAGWPFRFLGRQWRAPKAWRRAARHSSGRSRKGRAPPPRIARNRLGPRKSRNPTLQKPKNFRPRRREPKAKAP